MFKNNIKWAIIASLIASMFCFSAAVLAAPPIQNPYQQPGQQTSQPTQQQSGASSEIQKQLEAAAGQGGAGYGAPEDPRLVVAQIIRVALGLMGMIFLVLVIYGGFLWMTAGGNEEKVGDAKKTIYYAVIGLLIVITAYAITFFAFRIAFKATEPSSSIRIQGPLPLNKCQGADCYFSN